RARQHVPHHPAGRGDVEQPPARGQIEIEREMLLLLENDAAMAMADCLGQARRPRGEKNPQRMIERNLREAEFLRGYRWTCEQLVPEDRMARERFKVLGTQIRKVDDVLQRRELLDDAAHLGLAVEGLAAVLIAIGAEQHFG